MSKAGVSPQEAVGTAIPSPSDIPHSTPTIGIASTSPTSSSIPSNASGMGTSPGKDGAQAGFGTGRENNRTFGQ